MKHRQRFINDLFGQFLPALTLLYWKKFGQFFNPGPEDEGEFSIVFRLTNQFSLDHNVAYCHVRVN